MTTDAIEAEAQRAAAMLALDFDALDHLIDDECTYIHSTGTLRMVYFQATAVK